MTTSSVLNADRAALTAQFDERLTRHYAETFQDKAELLTLSQHYRREGYVKINKLVPEDLRQEVSKEVYDILDLHAKRIDLEIKETGNTPRKMSTVSQKNMAQTGTLIPALYESPVLMGFLSQLAQQPVLQCPWEEEKYIITRQEKVGDTHGWHWGDFSFTVIWIIEAPSLEYGGILQCIPHTNWDKQNPRTHEYFLNNTIKSYGHKTGEIYFLRSDTTLHRTIPLNADKTRIILNTCWGSESDQKKEPTHETMHVMFD